jgi:hypothetical protein
VNPGNHVARIQRGTAVLATRTITLAAGAVETVRIEVPVKPPDLVLHKIPDPPVVTAPAASNGPVDQGSSNRTWLRSPWFWSGAAVVIVGGGATAYLLTRSPDGLRVH